MSWAQNILIVTRPEPLCGHWVEQFRAAGFRAIGFPLLHVEPAPQTELVHDRLAHWLNQPIIGHKALMFVSGMAFERLLMTIGTSLSKQVIAASFCGVRFWVTGPASAQTLMDNGIDAAAIDCPDDVAELSSVGSKFDSRTLWAKVKVQVTPGSQIAVVRGISSGEVPKKMSWLEQQLLSRHCQVTALYAYQRHSPVWTPSQIATMESAVQEGAVWLLNSTEAMQYLPKRDWNRAKALVNHRRQLDAAIKLGFFDVRLSDPRIDQVIASLKCFT